jgi:DNA-binding protein H-NS
MKTMTTVMKQLDAMNFDELLTLRAKIEAMIDARVGEERRRLTASLRKLDTISGAPTATRKSSYRNGKAKRTLTAKYRNPANPEETWAGRGLKPRWLTAALKGGKKKLADFLVTPAN